MTALELISRDKPFATVLIDAAVVLEIYHDRKPYGTLQVESPTWSFLLTCWSKVPSERPNANEFSDFFLNAIEEHEVERQRLEGHASAGDFRY